ncbi:hypothetical protein H4R19_004432 [Coemansia spiralis]|nr:hypothetical protein H4R19_004432 [Coemansia spiralis]
MEFLLRTGPGLQRQPTREQVMGVYRGILREAREFFDDTTRAFIKDYTRSQFKRYLYDKKGGHLKWARTTQHLLERANRHMFKDVVSVLEYGYRLKGPGKRELMDAMVGVSPKEQIFGNLHEVARYRPAFYALAAHQVGESKLHANTEALRSQHPLNIAKTQDAHWEQLRYKLTPPVDRATMDMLEERTRTGVVMSSALRANLAKGNADDVALVQKWEARWVRVPPKRQISRYYRSLLGSVSVMDVETVMVANTGKYAGGKARRHTTMDDGSDKPDMVPKRVYTFTKSSMAGNRPPQEASAIDVAGLVDKSA